MTVGDLGLTLGAGISEGINLKSRFVLGRMVVTATAVVLMLSLLAVSQPADAARGYELRTVEGKVLRWSPCQAEITYKVNVRKAGGRMERREARRDIKTAFRKLSNATRLHFVHRPGRKRVPTGSGWYEYQGGGSEIVVAYVKRSSKKFSSTLLPRTAWGVAGYRHQSWGSPSQTVIGRGYVLIDSDRAKRMRAGFGAGLTSGNLLLHELGHVVGLDHVASNRHIMYPTVSRGTPRGYSTGDRAGLARVGAEVGCRSFPG